MDYKKRFLKVLIEGSRILLGVVFIFSGLVKAIDPMGFAIKIGDYFTAFSLDFLNPFSTLMAFNLSALEFTLGMCMLLGAYRRFTSILIFLFMLVMTPLTLYLAVYNPVSDCGCFGDAVVISNWETFLKNVVLLAASFVTLIYNQQIFRVYTYKVFWFIFFFSYLYCIGFCYQNFYHLPLLDFRPYKIGTNIPEKMNIPDDAEEDEYNFIFVYEKDGVKKEFGITDYPANDPEWTFVETHSELTKEGFRPEINDFFLYDLKNDDDVTERILHDKKPVILIIAPRVEKASDERIDQINNVYDYALDNQITFYCVTGSNEREIRKWIDYTGAEYDFLIADETLLKTIIRSNPGMVLLKEGTVLMKWHYKDIPDEEDIETVLNSYLNGKEDEISKQQRLLRTNLFGFALPLLLVWVYDFLRNRRRKKSTGKEKPELPVEEV